MNAVLVVDSSPGWIRAMRGLIDADPEMTLVGVAHTGREAVQLCEEHHPDLIVMDVDTPFVKGVSAFEAVMREYPTPIVLSTASSFHGNAFDLLREGAVDVVHKGVLSCASEGAREDFKRRLKVIAGILVAKRRRCAIPSRQELRAGHDVTAPSLAGEQSKRRNEPRADHEARRSAAAAGRQHSDEGLLPASRGTVRAAGIVASTGGPDAIHRLLGPLPGDLPFGILVVQHLAVGFLGSFVEWLDAACELRVSAASNGQRLLAGEVLVAPDGSHLTLSGSGRVRLVAPRGETHLHCPSGDLLLHSMAEAVGREGVGIVLSGIGRDGADGLMGIQRAGGVTMAQSRASCAIFGMPGACVADGAAQSVLTPERMARYLRHLGRAAPTASHADGGPRGG